MARPVSYSPKSKTLTSGLLRLPTKKQRLYDIIRRAGIDGIPPEIIAGLVYGDRTKLALVRVHVNQMNKLLASLSIEITGQCPRGFYRLRFTGSPPPPSSAFPAGEPRR